MTKLNDTKNATESIPPKNAAIDNLDRVERMYQEELYGFEDTDGSTSSQER